jgi:Bacterial DNA-binding protein
MSPGPVGRFSLPDFGAFTVRETPRRTALNPRTGEKVPPPHPYVSELDRTAHGLHHGEPRGRSGCTYYGRGPVVAAAAGLSALEYRSHLRGMAD